jgi:hypothetical protein
MAGPLAPAVFPNRWRFCFKTKVRLAPSPNVPHKLHFRTGRPAIIPPSRRLTSTPAWIVRIPSWRLSPKRLRPFGSGPPQARPASNSPGLGFPLVRVMARIRLQVHCIPLAAPAWTPVDRGLFNHLVGRPLWEPVFIGRAIRAIVYSSIPSQWLA